MKINIIIYINFNTNSNTMSITNSSSLTILRVIFILKKLLIELEYSYP